MPTPPDLPQYGAVAPDALKDLLYNDWMARQYALALLKYSEQLRAMIPADEPQPAEATDASPSGVS